MNAFRKRLKLLSYFKEMILAAWIQLFLAMDARYRFIDSQPRFHLLGQLPFGNYLKEIVNQSISHPVITCSNLPTRYAINQYFA